MLKQLSNKALPLSRTGILLGQRTNQAAFSTFTKLWSTQKLKTTKFANPLLFQNKFSTATASASAEKTDPGKIHNFFSDLMFSYVLLPM